MYSAVAINRDALEHLYIEFRVCHKGVRYCVHIQPWCAIKVKRLIKSKPSKYTLSCKQNYFCVISGSAAKRMGIFLFQNFTKIRVVLPF